MERQTEQKIEQYARETWCEEHHTERTDPACENVHARRIAEHVAWVADREQDR